MPLNADQLHAFWTVVQTGSYHRAAEALFISQSAVTQRIQALEGTLGQKLFVRAGRGVSLTEAGQLLSRYCRDHQQAEESLLQALQGNASGLAGRLAVASGSVEGCQWLHPVLSAMGRENPDLDLTLVIDAGLDPIALLESGKVDAVLSEIPVKRRGIRSTRIGAMTYLLAIATEIASDWPERPDGDLLRSVRAIDFNPQDRVTLDHLALCLPDEDFSELRRHFVNDTLALINWVLAGGGYSALPMPFLAPHLDQGRLRILFPEVTSKRHLYWATPDFSPSPASALAMTRLRERLANR